MALGSLRFAGLSARQRERPPEVRKFSGVLIFIKVTTAKKIFLHKKFGGMANF